jgi:hypothetical protein
MNVGLRAFVRTVLLPTVPQRPRTYILLGAATSERELIVNTRYWVDFCADSDPTSPRCLNICDQLGGGFGTRPRRHVTEQQQASDGVAVGIPTAMWQAASEL